VDVPDVRYARAGGVAIAYQVVGEGPRDLVFSPLLSDLHSLWLAPYSRPFLDRLASEVRLVVFDARGTGLSDRPQHVTLEARMDDIGSVLDAIGSRRASLLGISTSGNVCALFAATYPDRCERLVLERPAPGIRSDRNPYGDTREEWLSWIGEVRERFGEREFLEEWARALDPALSESQEALDWFVWQRRTAVSPASAAEWARTSMETDITDVLGSIRVPTLVLHPADQRDIALFVSERVKDSRMLQVESVYSAAAADAILEFVRGESPRAVPDSVLATVLFTDIVGSTERAAGLGNARWRDLLEEHQSDVRRELVRYRGIEIDTAGDGFFCRFDGPARAIACARRIVEAARGRELEVRAGIHTGECELVGEKIAGIAVVTGARISALAAPGEVLVSSTVKDLVAGSGLAFEERGEHELKGVPDAWRLYAVLDA
jgi:class 3 adenylate cyclase/pimeloyl-ACP methyl ester carboxylesterase